MKPRIKRAMLPRKGAYSVYVNEKCLPYESLHHLPFRSNFNARFGIHRNMSPC